MSVIILKLKPNYPFAKTIAPTQLGLCGNSDPSLFPAENQGFLPAEPLTQIKSDKRESIAWYAVELQALEAYLQATVSYSRLIDPSPPLTNMNCATSSIPPMSWAMTTPQNPSWS